MAEKNSKEVLYLKKTVTELKELLKKKGKKFPVKQKKDYYIQRLLDSNSSEDEEQDENNNKQEIVKPKEPKEEKKVDFEKFNNELELISENFKETKEEKKNKILFKNEILNALKQDSSIFKDTQINEYGSLISGFGTIHSNADFHIKTNQKENVSYAFRLKEIEEQLDQNGIGKEFELKGLNTLIPKLILKDQININYTIAFGEEGVKTSYLFSSYNRLDERVNKLIVLIKTWAKHNEVNKVLNSLSLTLLGIFYLQSTQPSVLPIIDVSRKESFKDMKWTSKNKSSLSTLFFGFIEYYSKFAFTEKKISVRTGELIKITNKAKIFIQEPCNSNNTTNIDSEKLKHISNSFKASLKTMKTEESISSLFPEFEPKLSAFQELKRKTTNQTIDSDELERPTKRHKVLGSIENIKKN